jgi:hypothetical protein
MAARSDCLRVDATLALELRPPDSPAIGTVASNTEAH